MTLWGIRGQNETMASDSEICRRHLRIVFITIGIHVLGNISSASSILANDNR